MKKVILVISLLLAVVLVSTCKKRESIDEEGKSELMFKAVKERESIFALSTQYLNSSTEKPSDLKDLPKGVTADFVYFLPKLADRNTPMILSSYSELKRSVLYVDTDGDGYLSDEKGYDIKLVKTRHNRKEYRFGPVLAEFHDAERKLEPHFFAVTYNGQQLILYPAGYCVGKVRLGEKTYRVAVIDGNFDGRYDKIFSPPGEIYYWPGCDLFAIDPAGDNKLRPGRLKVIPLAKMLRVQNINSDVYYNIDVAADGSSLELEMVEPEFGILDLAGAHVRFELWSDTACNITNNPFKKYWQLPSGRYTALLSELRHVDNSGNRWIFRSSRGKAGILKDFEIIAGQNTQFKIGPPFSIKTSTKRDGGIVLVEFGLQGQAGELYIPGAQKGGATIPVSKLEIVDDSGKVLESGLFKYG